MPPKCGVRVGAGTYRYKVEQLELVLERKKKHLQRLQKINQVLAHREQVVAECLAQQADVLHIFGRFAFTMPDAGDPQYEQKATVAVQALLKDMEAAELLQEANRIMASHIPMRSGSSSQQAEQAEPQQQEQVQQQQGYGIRILRSHLERPDCMQLIRRLHQASVEELADMLSARMMELGFALATYPSSSYMDPVELEALPDSSLQQRKQAANVRLQQTLDDYSAIIFLLHVSHDKVLNLSLLDLETLQPETPTASYWQEIAARVKLRRSQLKQLHTGFTWYNNKRSELTAQMQQAVGELQLLLGPPPAAAAAAAADNSSGGHGKATAANNQVDVPLEQIEHADKVLQRLSRLVWQLREVSRCLIFQFANVLDPYQLAACTVHAWPFILQPPPVIEEWVKGEVQRQQQEETGDSKDEWY